jgi:predicted DCC family thiol-disulfide oxidoreductase YuxK
MERIVYFDGVCNLCNAVVLFILKYDPNGKFKFCTLQSPQGKKTLEENRLSSESPDTFLLSENGKLYTRSAAALRVMKELSGGWPLLYGLIIVPAFLRDFVYRMVSKNRYRWFGKKATCMVPTPEIKSRFIS